MRMILFRAICWIDAFSPCCSSHPDILNRNKKKKAEGGNIAKEVGQTRRLRDRGQSKVRKVKRAARWQKTRAAGSRKSRGNEWCTKIRREEHSSKERRKKREGSEAGRVTFTVRADQFPVPSIIDVTSAVGCYLSGLTNRNTIPTGSSPPPQTHTHTHKYTSKRADMQANTQSEEFTP